MKYYNLFAYCVISLHLLTLGSLSFAEEKGQGTELLNRVYELGHSPEMVQVGDATIINYGSIWLDNGDGNITEGTFQEIREGDLIRAFLTDRNEDGFWTADRIVVLSGSALDAAVKASPELQYNPFEDEEQPEKTPPAPPRTGKPFLNEDGVWVN